jgi:hypothetical protein
MEEADLKKPEHLKLHAQGKVCVCNIVMFDARRFHEKCDVIAVKVAPRERSFRGSQVNATIFNRLKQVPVYVEGNVENPDFVLTESGAIIMYLLEKFDSANKLLPKAPHARAKVYQFASFAPSEMYHTLVPIFLQGHVDVKDEKLIAVKTKVRFDIARFSHLNHAGNI